MKMRRVDTPDGIKSRDVEKSDLDVWSWINLCMELEPKRLLELGTGRGLFLSSVIPVMPEAMAVTVNAPLGQKTDGTFTTFETPGDEIGELFRGQPYSRRIEQVFCLTRDMIKHLYGLKFDMIHIDASHDKDDIILDSINSVGILSDHGTIVWHDFHPDNPEPWNREVFEAIDFLQANGYVGEISWFERSWVAYWSK